MGSKWEVSIRQYNDSKRSNLFNELVFVTNDIADVQDLKDDMDRLSTAFKTEIVVKTVEVNDEI